MARYSRLTLFGIPLRTSWTWMFVALSMTVISFFQLAPGASGDHLLWSVGAAVLAAGTVASILAHEFGHVTVARRCGERFIAIEPSLLGALPDTSYLPASPANEVRVALAGPLTNLVLAIAFSAIWWTGGSPDSMPGVSILILAGVNAGMTAIGLLPGYPFDGGRVFRAFLWYLTGDLVRSTRVASVYGHVLLFVALLGGVVLLSAGETSAVWGTWILILCWTINRARAEGFSQTLWSEAGRSLQIDDLFQAGVNRVPASSTIDESIESLLDNFRRGPTLVVDHMSVVGIVELAAVRRVPRASWTQTSVGEIMTSLDGLRRLESSTPVNDLLEALPAGSGAVVLVENSGQIVAAADREFVVERVESYIRAQHFARRRRA